MSVLNNANDIKLGSNQVTSIFSGSTLIWRPTAFWNFNTPANGDELTVLVSPSAEINWGDGNTETLANNTETTHIYTTGFIPNSFDFSVPADVTYFQAQKDINPGDATFRGVINVDTLPNLERLNIRNHLITDIIGVDRATDIIEMNVISNSLDGDIKQYMPPNIEDFRIQMNSINEPIPNNTLAEYTALRIIATSANYNMSGLFPAFNTNIEVIDFGNCGMSGNLPSLTSYTNLNRLWLYFNSFSIQSGWVVQSTLTDFNISDNSLTSTEVNRVLIAFDNAGASYGTLNLGGNNAAPTGTGITAKNSLISKSWSIHTS